MATTKIKCPVEGIIDLDRLPGVDAEAMRALIDAPELQRLRRIRQLGFTEYVYPGATHTRFSHSLGAFQGAQRTLFALRERSAPDLPDEWLVATALACLLHDVGHGPFSHTFESVTGTSHEDRTREILLHGPQVPERLRAIDPALPGRVAALVSGEAGDDAPPAQLAWLHDLVSSALDCDRMDYLRRDALHTGAGYGNFDRDWIVREMLPHGDAIVVVEKGRTAVEQYLIGRYHMFQNVYLHKTSRGFEGAFRMLCRRLDQLGVDALPPQATHFRRLHQRPLPLADFLRLDDVGFVYEFALLLDHPDPTVRALARCLHGRRPLRQHSFDGQQGIDELEGERQELAREQGLDPACAVFRDAASDVPYRPYAPRAGRKGLRLLRADGTLVDITELSPTIEALSGRTVTHRLYWVET